MRRVWIIVCCGLFLAPPGVALGAGGPVLAIQGSDVSAPGSTVSYVALGAGRDTVVRRVRRGDGEVEQSVRLSGIFGVAGAATDGSTTGLSADGRTLVLAEMPATYPPRQTSLDVLDAARLVTRARITLAGYYTVDAISPGGRWLYLIHYVSPNGDPTRYEVRAYDLLGHRLMRDPVIDPRDHGEAMLGVAITRAVSSDGRWAYTLYDRPGSTPFIHALDTEGRRAVCVDLPAIPGQGVFGAQLAVATGGGTLSVERSGATIASVNTRTFAVHSSTPTRPRSVVRRASSAAQSDGLWWALGAGLIVVLGAATGLSRRWRTGAHPPAPRTHATIEGP